MENEPATQPIEFDISMVKFDSKGLVPAIVQDVENGDVLMMAWMNFQTLQMSLNRGQTVFWSRSRSEVWAKGETSGDVQLIRSASYDCDGDTLLFKVTQLGAGACHTGNRTCFFTQFGGPINTTRTN